MAKKWYEELAVLAQIDPASSTTSTITTDTIDMMDTEAVMFIVQVGAIADTGTVDFVVNMGSVTGTITTSVTAITQLTTADDNKQVIVHVRGEDLTGRNRYIAGVSTQATAASLLSVTALGSRRYNPANEHDLASVDEIVG